MSGSNGGHRLLLLDAAGNPRPETVTTIHEYLSKPERAVTRCEMAGFVESITVNEIAPLIRQAMRHYDHTQARDTIASMIVAREAELRERKWYRRLWRAVVRRRTVADPDASPPHPPGFAPHPEKPNLPVDSGQQPC